MFPTFGYSLLKAGSCGVKKGRASIALKEEIEVAPPGRMSGEEQLSVQAEFMFGEKAGYFACGRAPLI